MRKTLLGTFLISILCLPVPAAPPSKTAGLTGKITVTAHPRKAKKTYSSSYYDDSETQPTPTPAPSQPEEIIVYVERVPGKWIPPQQPAILDQQGIRFTHRILPILKGTVVKFTNQDPIYHNVFSNSQNNKSFDLGKKSKGQSASVTLANSEVPVKVFCEIHSSMAGNILVLQNPFFTTVAPGGVYRLEGLPPGTYRVVVWHDYWEPVKFKVTLKAGETKTWDVMIDKVRP